MSMREASTSRIGGHEQLDRYELVCVLAQAGFGSLWASIITSGDDHGKVVALRRVVTSSEEESAVVEPIRTVGNALIGERLDKVVPVLDVVVSPGRLGVVSEYIEGQSLHALRTLATLKNAPIPLAIALRMMGDVLDGLDAVHKATTARPELANYVHGGLSPDTMFISISGETVLLDLGPACAAATIPSLANQPNALAYRAPEHVRPGELLDARTDVFLAGILLWELLTRRSLFLADAKVRGRAGKASESEIAHRILTAPLLRLDSPKLDLPEPLSDALVNVVERALDRSPAKRFASAGEMKTALMDAGDTVAEPSDVALLLDELCRSTLETRRAAIERALVTAPRDVKASPPAPPVPKDILRAEAADLTSSEEEIEPEVLSLRDFEAPEAPPAPPPPVFVGAAKAIDRAEALGPAEAISPPQEAVPSNAEPAEPVPVEPAPATARRGQDRESRRRMGLLLMAGLAGVVVLLGAILGVRAFTSPSPKPPETSVTTATTSVAPTPTPTPTPTEPVEPIATASASSEPSEEDASPPEEDSGSGEPDTTKRPTRPKSTRPYMPSGI